MILRSNWLKMVKDYRLGFTDAEIEAMSTDRLLEIINNNDIRDAEKLKRQLSNALNDFENCLTKQGLTDIHNNYPHLHNNTAFQKAYEKCLDNLTKLKI